MRTSVVRAVVRRMATKPPPPKPEGSRVERMLEHDMAKVHEKLDAMALKQRTIHALGTLTFTLLFAVTVAPGIHRRH